MRHNVLVDSLLAKRGRIQAVSPIGYFRTVACAFLLFLFAAAVVNILVDPKGVYQLVRIDGFNFYKPFQPDYTKEVKALGAQRYRPDTIVFGASTIMFGVDAQCRDSGLPAVSRVYNYAGAGASPDAFVTNFADLMAIGSVRRVVLEARFENHSFTKRRVTNGSTYDVEDGLLTRFIRRWLPANYVDVYFKNLFSWNELVLSGETLLANRQADKSFLFRGFEDNGNYDQEWLRRWGAWVITEQNLVGHVSHYSDFLLARVSNDMDIDLSYIDQLAMTSQRHGVALDIFITPVHVSELLFYREGGIWPLYEKFKTEVLRSVVDARQRYSTDIRLFDFANLSDIVMQTIKPIDLHEFHEPFSDPVHFKRVVGDLLLATMLKCGIPTAAPDSFGIELNQTNIQDHLAAEKAKLDAYGASHPDLVRKISDVIGGRRKGSFGAG
jgi:hypothetical protein